MSSPIAKIPVLFLGATGYVGGTFLSRIFTTPKLLERLDITLYVRSAEKAKRLADEFSVKTIVGTLADLDKLENAAENAHIVVSIANADDVDMTKAILRGLKKRHVKLNDRPFMYHTSGTGVLIDWTYKLGDHIDGRIYSDLEVDELEKIDEQAIHRPVDVLLLEADRQGYARTVLVLPPTIFGAPEGVLFDKKIANPHSLQIPALIRGAIERKRAGLIGSGLAIWDHVHVVDLAELYMLLMRLIVDSPEKVAHGRDGWYFAESGEHLHFDLVNHVAQALFELGELESPEPVRFVTEEQVQEGAKKERFNAASGTNARSRAFRARQLGWAPKRTVLDVWASIKPEAEIIMREMGKTPTPVSATPSTAELPSTPSKRHSRPVWQRVGSLFGRTTLATYA